MTLLLVASLATAVVAAAAVWWVVSRELTSRSVAFILAMLVFASVAVLPHEVRGAAQRIRLYHHYSRVQADRAGALNFGLHPMTFDRVAQIVPRDDTLFVRGTGKF